MKCVKCNKGVVPLVSFANPDYSEYYCYECDKSYLMTDEQFKTEAQRMGKPRVKNLPPQPPKPPASMFK